jgi:hypothetical protein
VAGVITAAAVLPVISWVASQIVPHGATTTVGTLASALGSPFVAAEGPWDIGVRAVLCVGVAAGSAVTVERALRRARADAQAKLG